MDILFGNPLFEDPLNLILIKSKQFIYRMKMKKSLPIFETFQMQLYHIFKTEEYIAKKKLDLKHLGSNGIITVPYLNNHLGS